MSLAEACGGLLMDINKTVQQLDRDETATRGYVHRRRDRRAVSGV